MLGEGSTPGSGATGGPLDNTPSGSPPICPECGRPVLADRVEAQFTGWRFAVMHLDCAWVAPGCIGIHVAFGPDHPRLKPSWPV
jgi:hypothetical protein